MDKLFAFTLGNRGYFERLTLPWADLARLADKNARGTEEHLPRDLRF